MRQLAIFLFLASLSVMAEAVVLEVPSAEFPSIDSAIQASGPADEIVVVPGHYSEGGIDCEHGVTIRSSEPGAVVVIDAQGHDFGLRLDVVGANAFLADVEIRGARDGLVVQGEWDAEFALSVTRCSFVDCIASGVDGERGRSSFVSCRFASNGGHGWEWSNGAATMTECVVESNSDTGIWAVGLELEISGTEIIGNSGNCGGGLALFHGLGRFRDILIENNAATSAGGGVYVSSAGVFRFDDCVIRDCHAPLGAHGYFTHSEMSIDVVFNCCELDSTLFEGDGVDAGMVAITEEGCATPVQGRSWSAIKKAFR